MTLPTNLVLRDVHLPPASGWWPPAPGWWVLIAVPCGLLLWLGWRWWRRHMRRLDWMHAFDLESVGVGSDAQQLAAISSLLRRASRRVDPHAERLSGEDWLRFLDGRKRRDFSQGPGRRLLDGAFQREPVVVDMDVIRRLAKQRFLELMAGRR